MYILNLGHPHSSQISGKAIPRRGWYREGTSLANSFFSDTSLEEKTVSKEKSQCHKIPVIPKGLGSPESGTTENSERMPEWRPNSRY